MFTTRRPLYLTTNLLFKVSTTIYTSTASSQSFLNLFNGSEIAKMKEFLPFHRCADENDGFAMWFHKKKSSGSGLSKSYYFEKKDRIKVFHANDITSSIKKIEVLKNLGMWYVHNDFDRAVPVSIGFPKSSNVTSVEIRKIGSRKFYIYDWPAEVMYIYDKLNPWKHENFGAGPVLDAPSGQFNTYMHSLFPIVLERLRRHPMRTMTAGEAAWVFVPYDITGDSYYNQNGNLDKVLQLLGTSPLFLKNKGSDHFFIDSSEPFW